MAITLTSTAVQLASGDTLPNFTSMTQFGAIGSYSFVVNFGGAVSYGQTVSGSNLGYRNTATTNVINPQGYNTQTLGNVLGSTTVGYRNAITAGSSAYASMSDFRSQLTPGVTFPAFAGSWRAHAGLSAPVYNVDQGNAEQGFLNYAVWGLVSRVS